MRAGRCTGFTPRLPSLKDRHLGRRQWSDHRRTSFSGRIEVVVSRGEIGSDREANLDCLVSQSGTYGTGDYAPHLTYDRVGCDNGVSNMKFNSDATPCSTDELVADFACSLGLVEVDAEIDARLHQNVPAGGHLDEARQVTRVRNQDRWERSRLR